MSTVTVAPGSTVIFDPSDKRTILFDFDQLNLAPSVTLTSYVLTITAIQQFATALTKDNDGLVAGSRKVTARFLATTATVGDEYRISVKGITNESPVQEKEYSIFLIIRDK